MRKNKKMGSRILSLVLGLTLLLTQLPMALMGVSADTAVPIIDIDATTKRGEISPYTLGSNHRHAYGGFGMYDEENDQVYPDFLEKTKEANLGVVRYPGGTIANLFTWKDTIGPREERSNVVLGNNMASVFPYYGLDEHMQYCEDIGAEVVYMVGEAAETPQGVADLVEYLNAPNDGSNPGGGTDWAAVRAEYGHPEPYGVTYFEIGNEMYIDIQEYWISLPSVYGDTDRARRYMQGDTVRATGLPARKYGTWTDNTSDGSANQSFYTQYNPVVEGTDAVYVNGVKWTRVDSLSTAGSTDTVYTIDYLTGEIAFGDGVNGAIPADAAKITCDYHHKHAGFTEYYDAMKAIDPDIKIFANLPASFNFVEGTKCDGIVYHNYPGYSGYATQLSSAEDLHDVYMRMSDDLIRMIDDNVTQLRERSKRQDTIAAVTEFGSINNPVVYSEDTTNEGREEARNLSRALSFAAAFSGSAKKESLIHIQQAFTAYSFGGGPGLPNADYVYNSMYAPDPDNHNVFIEGGTALAYKVIGNNIGDTYRNAYVQNNPTVGSYASYDALVTTVTQDDETGDLYLMVVNRDAHNDITSAINLKGYTITGNARIQTLNGAEITTCNTPENPNAIYIAETESPLGIGGSSFSYTFPAHSLVAIKLTGTTESDYADHAAEDFQDTADGAVPDAFTVTGDATVQTVEDEKVLVLSRSGANVTVRAPFAEDGAAFTGLARVKLRVCAMQSTAALRIGLASGTSEALNLTFEGGFIKNNGTTRAVYTPGQFHEIEIAVDHKAGQYVLYFDGGYIGSLGEYTPAAGGLDALVVTAMNQNGTFYIDDYSVQTADTELTSQITQIDDVRVSTVQGEAPELPDTVTVRYNTGDSETRQVTWESTDDDAFAAAGTVVVNGTVDGVEIPARAVVTVNKPIKEIQVNTVSTLVGNSPQMPAEVTVVYADGSQESQFVVWDAIDEASYATAGTFTVSGTVTALNVAVQATVNVVARANAPTVVVEAYTARNESGPVGGNMLDAFVENDPDNTIDALAEKGADGSLYLYMTNHSDRAVATAVSLKGYTISGAATIRTADAAADANLWANAAATETVAEMGVGESSFSYEIPAETQVAIKLTGTTAETTVWTDNFYVRHFSSAAVGATPTYFKNMGGTASVQKDPADTANQGFMLKRSGADVVIESTLSGQNYPVSAVKTYDDLLKITYRIKAAQSTGNFIMELTAGGSSVATLSFADGKVLYGDDEIGTYTGGAWHNVEVVIDHKAGEVSVYVNGTCLLYGGAYQAESANPLDYLYFKTVDTDATYYIDDYKNFVSDTNLVPKITQIDPVYVSVDVGVAPALPSQVTARYNTGEALALNVEWAAVEEEDYAADGVFEVTGTVKETGIVAKAIVTVGAGNPSDILKGDVDMNDKVDVADIMKLKALIMADQWSETELAIGDMDDSNALDVGDIMAVKNIIMSK